MIDTREASVAYMERGWSPIPIQRRSKGPRKTGWQELRLTPADAHLFDAAGNVGVILGHASSDLTDLDLDCAEAVELADLFLPPTRSVFGRQSKPRSHRLYTAAPAAPQTIKFPDPTTGETLLELRGEGGQQTVLPPSTHPSGERVEWISDDPPAVVDAEELIRAAMLLAAACLLCRCNSAGRTVVIGLPDQVWLDAAAGAPLPVRHAIRVLLTGELP